MTNTTTKTTVTKGWQYQVTDGTKSRPAGYIGTFTTRELAQDARSKRCRMGGYITRVSSSK